jgi:hypothetical protein
MKTTAELLSVYETCPRAAFWYRFWEREKLDGHEMLLAGIRSGLTSTRKDFGEVAGEECYGLGAGPGLLTDHYDVHSEVIHLACIADIVTTAVRRPDEAPWGKPENCKVGDSLWRSGVYMDPAGTHLRRVVLVSSWSDDRHYSECRSWESLGNVCVYGLPMQQAVIVLGQNRNGKRHSPWAKGLRHPANRKLRFRKKTSVKEGFKSSWIEVWREDYDEISTHDWLQSMLEDGVLQDVCFNVDLPVPEKNARQRILDLAARKLERLNGLTEVPDLQLTGCDWPRPCLFRGPCHQGKELSRHFGMTKIVEDCKV